MFSLFIATQSTTRFILLDTNKLPQRLSNSAGATYFQRTKSVTFHSGWVAFTQNIQAKISWASKHSATSSKPTPLTMSPIEELYEKGDRHRNDLNELYRITNATDQRLDNAIRDINSRLNDTSDQTSSKIQDLEKTLERGKGYAFELEVHVKETARRFRGITDLCNQQRQQIHSLQTLVSTLTTRLDVLEAIPSRRCTSCAKVIQPIKASHLKCEECYLNKRSRTCTICSSSYLPVHFSYTICPPCYLTKKRKKNQKAKPVKLPT